MVICRNCKSADLTTVIDLGSAPISNGYLDIAGLERPEKWFPLNVEVCAQCWLVQTRDFLGSNDVFTSEYAYFSSMSSSWIEHSRRYVESVVDRFGLNQSSFVIEVAANDGYLLQFMKSRGIPCLGIEPTTSTATAARAKGIQIFEEFLTTETAEQISNSYGKADLVVANNVLAHVPDISDFARSFAKILKDKGVITVEFPSVSTLVDGSQFDTIYHEHFSYLSLHSALNVFSKAGLEVFDVESIHTHGGSLRIYAQHEGVGGGKISTNVGSLLEMERERGVLTSLYYQQLQESANATKSGLLDFLLSASKDGKSVAAYGAAAKGNTLLNYAGVRPDLLPYVVDKSPGKVGKFMPGSRIPILPVEEMFFRKPDLILILPWNIADEVAVELNEARDWGARLFTAVPSIREIPFRGGRHP